MNEEGLIKDFIIDELGYAGDREMLDLEYPLLDKRVLDSLGMFKLVAFLEDRFDISIDDEEILPENFSSIAAVIRLVTSKK